MVLPAVQETGVRSLGWEDPLEEGMATNCSIAWETPWTEEPARLQFMGLQRVGHDCVTNTNMHISTCAFTRVCTCTHTHTQLDQEAHSRNNNRITSQGDWFVNVKSSWDIYLQVYYFLIFWSSLVFKKFCPLHEVRCIIHEKSIFRPLDFGQAIAFIVPNSALFVCLWTLKKKLFHTSRIFF